MLVFASLLVLKMGRGDESLTSTVDSTKIAALMDESSPNPTSSSPEANAHFKSGVDLKSRGQPDAALTSFRRAVIADPKFAAAHYEVGLLCRERSKRDRTFLRYTFESFRQAARLDPQNEDAHNHYIMAGQQMGVLDDLMLEYGELVRRNPENALFAKFQKNILALSMAMMPDKVSVGDRHGAGSIRKLALIVSVVLLFAGMGFLLASPMLLKAHKLTKPQAAIFVRIGIGLFACGLGGFVVRSQL